MKAASGFAARSCATSSGPTSIATTSCPRRRSASCACAPERSDTLRSSELPALEHRHPLGGAHRSLAAWRSVSCPDPSVEPLIDPAAAGRSPIALALAPARQLDDVRQPGARSPARPAAVSARLAGRGPARIRSARRTGRPVRAWPCRSAACPRGCPRRARRRSSGASRRRRCARPCMRRVPGTNATPSLRPREQVGRVDALVERRPDEQPALRPRPASPCRRSAPRALRASRRAGAGRGPSALHVLAG